jgi:hypothetical protein
MDKKLIILGILAIFLMSSALSSASIIINQNEKIKLTNKEIYLGQASIYGDGIEENTTIDLTAENDMTIRISSQTEVVNFYIDYTINTTNGLIDNGAISLLIQINGDNKGNNETISFSYDIGKLIVENIEVQRQDLLTFQIAGVYTNLNPPFVVTDITAGGGIINHNSRFQRMFHIFPFIENILIKNTLFSKILY